MQMENRNEWLVKFAICSVYDNRGFIKFYEVSQECVARRCRRVVSRAVRHRRLTAHTALQIEDGSVSSLYD